MLKEAIEKIQSLANAAKKIDVVRETETQVLFSVDGQIYPWNKPVFRHHVVDSVDDLCSVIAAYGATDDASIWIRPDCIVAKLDGDVLVDEVRLPLTYDVPLLRLMELEQEKLTQQGLIQLLRHELPGVVGAESLLACVRKIRFRSGVAGHADIQHGRESLGREVENEVTGAGDIPEDATVECRVYCNPRETRTYTVRCFLQVFPETQQFTFRPAAGELHEIRTQAIEDIRSRIEQAIGKSAVVFFGEP